MIVTGELDHQSVICIGNLLEVIGEYDYSQKYWVFDTFPKRFPSAMVPSLVIARNREWEREWSVKSLQ